MPQPRAPSPAHSLDSEMHELNHEADYLEEKSHIVAAGPNGMDVTLQRHNNDPDAQAMVINSLRSQIQDLFSQVSQLNNKLVKSYDRMSDLEDELHVTTTNMRGATLRIGELELERAQHLSALSSGLLVEKDHVTTELNRLMERATEEAAQRGQAESARTQIEKELDDLSAGLFNQANSMVAEARIAQAKSERKAEETERALREAEEVVGLLQTQMQTLQAGKERADRRVEEMRVTMGKGKWVDRVQELGPAARPRLLCSHTPYHEYLAFITHLRSIRPASQHPPAMSTLLPLPFLARLVTEDSDPTVRLDLAPSLNWLTRRSVISAIHSGELTIEPMATAVLLQELTPSSVPGQPHNTHVSCALCGGPIIYPSGSAAASPTSASFPSPPVHRPNINNTWSSTLFKSTLVHSLSSAPSALVQSRSQSPAPPAPPADAMEPPAQVYIFRVAATSSGLPVSLQLSQQNNTQAKPTIYPLCTTHWCLTRLRSTCSMWAFVRTGIVEKVWDDGVYVPLASVRSTQSPAAATNGVKPDGVDGVSEMNKKSPVPPRRSRMGIGALWGSVQRSLSSGKDPESEKRLDNEPEKPLPSSPKKLPASPPKHPSISAPLPIRPSALPPPLPKRNRGREVATKEIAPPELAASSGDHLAVVPGGGPGEHAPANRTTPSNDITNPAEEPRALVGADPTTVPLPPTAPPTPELPSAITSELASEVQRGADSSAGKPGETTAEGAAARMLPAVAATIAQEQTGSRSASPAPPPLPRRAAARPRPMSVVTPTESTPSSEPKEEASKGANTSQEESTTQLPTGPTQDAGDSNAGAVVQEPSTAVDTAPQPEDVSGQSPTEVEIEAAPVGHSNDTETTEPAVADHENGENDVDSGPASPVSVAFSTNGVVDGVEGHSLKGRAGSPEPQTDSDTALYVGGATWEERTWKELTRLREEMFWARIGGLR